MKKPWNNYFELYKRIPQYEVLNSDMTLAEFKVIFYWEYFHRIFSKVNWCFYFNTIDLLSLF